jgi:hypothetical protein
MSPAGEHDRVEKDLTVALRAGSFDYQARLLNDGQVCVFVDGTLAGTALWDGERLVERSPALPDAVYDALSAALTIELDRIET